MLVLQGVTWYNHWLGPYTNPDPGLTSPWQRLLGMLSVSWRRPSVANQLEKALLERLCSITIFDQYL